MKQMTSLAIFPPVERENTVFRFFFQRLKLKKRLDLGTTNKYTGLKDKEKNPEFIYHFPLSHQFPPKKMSHQNNGRIGINLLAA
jgi:hypothetical protein